jgi:hypothetical protein
MTGGNVSISRNGWQCGCGRESKPVHGAGATVPRRAGCAATSLLAVVGSKPSACEVASFQSVLSRACLGN